MISGQQALQSIERATALARSQEFDLDAALRSVDAEVARLRADRLAAFRQLAQIKLDALERDGVVGDLDAAERRAAQLLATHAQATEALSARLAETQARHAQAEADRHAKADALAKAVADLESLQARVEPEVRASTPWTAQKAAVDQAAIVVEEAQKKATQSEADREAKGKPYEADPLFLYLWKRKFGTADYQSGFFVRFFDRKVANLIGYAQARPNYVMLNEIPARLRDHAERCKALLAEAQAKLADIELDGLRAAGSGPLEDAVSAAHASLSAADETLAAAGAALTDFDKQRETATGQSDGVYQQAIAVLVETDSRADIRELHRKAAETRTTEDDALVRRIDQAGNAIAAAERKAAEMRDQALELARRRTEIEQQRDNFRRRGYDNPYGQFGNENAIGDVLGELLKGAVRGGVLGDVLRGGYSERPRRADSGFGGRGGFNFPFPGGGGGGGWSGGSSGGGGGSDRGSDGFTTGGRF